jgi:hypothetical protein
VEGEEEHERDAREHRVAREQVDQVAVVVTVRVDRHAVDQVREPNAPDERDPGAPECIRPKPRGAPTRALALTAPLERDHADDQEEQEQQEREVEAREHRRVPGRERRECRCAGDDEPDFVPVPDRPNRFEHRAALGFVPRNERKQHADAEVKALEQEVAAPEDGDQDEPEDLQIHQYVTTGSGSSSRGGERSGRA